MAARIPGGPGRAYSCGVAWHRPVVTAAALLAGLALVTASGFVGMTRTWPALAALAIGLAVAPLAVALGVLVVRRRDNPVGAYLSLVGLAVALVVVRDTGARVLAGDPDRAQSLAWLVALTADLVWWVFAAVALLLLHFPTGRVPSRRWRWVPPSLLVATACTQLYAAVDTVPFAAPLEDLARPFAAPPFWVTVVAAVCFVSMLTLALSCGVSLVARYRRSTGLPRRQIRWLALGGLGVVAFPVLCLLEIALWGRPLWLSAVVGLLGLVAVPVTAGIALLRPDAYDVDRALSDTVTYGVLTALLLTLYAGVSVGAGVTLGRESALVAALVTAAGAILLAPLRTRLQRHVDGMVYPLRRAAVEAIDRLEADVATGARPPEDLTEVLRAALRDPHLKVSAPGPAAGAIALSAPEVTSDLLAHITRRATPLLQVIQLRAELAEALREAENSRARLVQTGYEERRRLERDLHDGAQQRLVSLGMALRLAQRHLADGTVDVDGLVETSVAELTVAVAELRQLAHGIRPSSLDDGLPAAVARLARNVPVTVDLRLEDTILPDDIATTAYFVISEALANAVKHAQASRIGLHLQRVDARVIVRVTDDGRGGALLSPESGMADRVAALGGSLRVASPPGRGTTVEAELPCAS